jgi:hypothetical protein
MKSVVYRGDSGLFSSPKYYLDIKIKEHEMGGACSTYRENKSSCRIVVGKTKIKEYLEDPVVDGIRILKSCLKNRDKLGANVNAVMNFRVTNGAG